MASDQELIEAACEIFAALGFELQLDSIDPFMQAEIYGHLSAIFYPHQRVVLEELLKQGLPESQKLQHIIDMVGYELPQRELASISGEGIAAGDRSQIAGFIGLFGELTRSLLEEYEKQGQGYTWDEQQDERRPDEDEEYVLPPKENS